MEEYNDRSFAVRGDTKRYKDSLRQIGGRWNPNLKGGAGWIFSKKRHYDQVKSWLTKLDENLNEAKGQKKQVPDMIVHRRQPLAKPVRAKPVENSDTNTYEDLYESRSKQVMFSHLLNLVLLMMVIYLSYHTYKTDSGLPKLSF